MVQYSNTIIDIIQKHRRERKQRTPGWEEMLTQVLQFYGLLWELKCAMPLWTWKYPVSCFPLSHTHRGTDWCMLTGQVKIRTQIHTLLKKKVRKKWQKKGFSIWRFQNLNTCHSPNTTCLTEADKLKAHVFHYAEDRIKIKKKKPHKKEKQNDSDVLVYTRYGNTYKLSKLWSEKSCYQATVKRVLWDLEILCLL